MLKLNLGAGDHPLPGFLNLDPAYESPWRFEFGIPASDATVDAITVSHALMYVPLHEWPAVFAEFARVLKPGGVLRVTEDATDDPASERYGGAQDAVTLTSLALVCSHIELAGLERRLLVEPADTAFRDGSLVQQWHGQPPKVFHFEGVKP